MALVTCQFFAETLGVSTAMTVLLPQPIQGQIGLTGVAPDDDPPRVLYLLHGLSDDETIWTRHTSIERYATEQGMAVVMPRAGRSFYIDETRGSDYGAFITEELPQLVGRFFCVSGRREETYVAGLSMGGYGALRWALDQPHRFAAAASLSGVLDVAHPTARHLLDQAVPHAFPEGDLTGGDHDLFARLERIDPVAGPRLYIGCGTEDFTHPSNRRFVQHARQAGWQPTVNFEPGDHGWSYWDRAIQDVLRWL